MDSYLICDETKKAMWLGKPIRGTTDGNAERVLFYHRGSQEDPYNHEDEVLNKILWKFLADNARKTFRVVFSGEFEEDDYEWVGSGDVETEEYLRGWPEG